MGGTSNYSNQINTALQQANQPKSQFAQQYSNYMAGGQYAQALGGLMNGTPNAFPGANGNNTPLTGGYNVPGSIFSQSMPQTSMQPGQGQAVSPALPQGGSQGFTPPAWSPQLQQQYGDLTSRQNISQMSQPQLQQAMDALTQKYAGQYAYTDANGNPTNYRPGYVAKNPDGSVGQLQYGEQYANGNSLSGWYDPSTGAQAPSGTYNTSSNLQDLAQGQDKYDYGYINQLLGASPGMLSVMQSPQFLYGQPLTNTSGNALFSDVPSGYNVFTGLPSPNATSNNPFISIQNGQYVDQYGNPLGPGPSSGGQPGQGQGNYNSLFPQIQSANPQFQQFGQQGQNPYQTLLQQLNPNSLPGNNFIPQQAQLGQFNQPYNSANDPYYQGVQQSLQQQQQLDQKNLLASFQGSGTSRGTPAAFALAQLQAQQTPQMASALGNVAQQEQQNQLGFQNLLQSGALQNAQMMNQYGLAGQQQGAQNILSAAGLNSQNANLALQNQLGNNTMLSNLSQFNTGQQNSVLQNYMSMLQQANQQQIQNQFSGYQNIAQLAATLAGSGIPGGSANVNLGGQPPIPMQIIGGML